ncbi:MAG TPA: polysaccharide deacetylase family protein [Gaiellaceae bacterium]|jgi:peptidoglycan/xylan/chitin deacetylase (PgdA/CDA1 family)|nr:polysaccharide deacetylase family protein [Gaiellaceae bacterium]
MPGRSRALVLCYHAVSDSWDDELAVTPGAFERQLGALLRWGYRPRAAVEAIDGAGRLLHVTFDDAYKNVVQALPALERLRVPATVFACAGYAEDGRPLAVPELALEAERHPNELATMTWDELRALVERGVEIGSHTLTHSHLTELGDDELDRELRESRERLEDRLHRRCRLLAYPYGDEDGRVRAAARAAGYDAAFGLSPGGRPDRYALPRVGVWRKDGMLRLALKTSPALRRAVARARSYLPVEQGPRRVPQDALRPPGSSDPPASAAAR